MKSKKIITSVLLLFVAVSLVAVIIKEQRKGAVSSDKSEVMTGDKTVVYFFHGNKRCKTCNNMEQYTRLALQENFAKEIQDGSVSLQLVNLDASGNGHYIDDYAMDFRVVVLSKLVAGKETKWKKLDQVWDLSGDEVAFKRYITTELSAMQEGDG